MPSTEYIGILGLTNNVADVFDNNSVQVASIDNNGNIGLLQSADAAFIASETIPANGTIERQLSGFGGSAISGQFLSTGVITLTVKWLDDIGGTVIREQNVINNAVAGDWKTFELEPTSPYIKLILKDDTGVDQTVNASYHYN